MISFPTLLKSKALLANIFKLLGNSSYGKMIEALERQTHVIYTKDEKLVDRTLRSTFFEDLDEIGSAYELESRKPRIVIRRPFHIGIAVYQLAKLRMLEFYYDFLDRYIDRRDFELIQMDTDSNYMAISGDKLEDQSCVQNLRRQRSSGCHGTSGASEHLACSNLNLKAAE